MGTSALMGAVVVLGCFATVLIGQTAAAAEAPGGPAASGSLAAVAKGNNAFALDLYALLAKEEGNLFFSPNSISTALAMTFAGARGETAEQMKQVLRFPCDGERLHGCFQALLVQLNPPEDEAAPYELHAANRLWGQQGFEFRRDFLEITRDYYASELVEVDFERAAEAARQRINAWVADETEQKIRDLIAPGVLQPLTRLVLTNAIYFLGTWERPFDKDDTKDKAFYVAPGHKVTAPLMRQTDYFGYAETDALQMIEMPYLGGALSMVVLLPKERYGLQDIEGTLSIEHLDQWLGALGRRDVRVFLPRFRVEDQFDLTGALKALGMTDAFGATADFSAMAAGPVFISAVIHKAFVDTDEKGTEAAAATAVMMVGSAMPGLAPRPPVFRADHPFVFLIRDVRSDSILFMGRVVNPER